MIWRAFSFGAAFLGLCASLAAQGLSRSGPSTTDPFSALSLHSLAVTAATPTLRSQGSFRTLNTAWYSPTPLQFADPRAFSFANAFGWVEASPNNFLPSFTAEAVPRLSRQGSVAPQAQEKLFGLVPKPDYVGGEVGVFYGRSISGKSKAEVEAGYIFSEIVEGNTHISVGASYEHSSGRSARIIGR